MTVQITTRTVYGAKCSRCSRSEQVLTEREADRWATEHREMHERFDRVGPTLAGLVFDVDAPDTEWFGHLVKAAEHARSKGFAYLTWNGQVLTSADPDVSNPLCLAVDVPGLISR